MATNIQNRIAKVKQTINPSTLINIGFPVFVEHTPVKTGNAVRHTSKTSSEINANYPYAKRLNQGYSPQHPEGMSKPTIAAMQAYIKKQLG
jgi:hypothetical protein